MNVTYKDFIAVFDGALTTADCKFIINEYESIYVGNPSEVINSSRHLNEQELGRKDYAIFADILLPKTSQVVNAALNKCIALYSEEYFSLKQVHAHSTTIKIQKTLPRGGYHSWHSEATDRRSMDRALTWMFYLNDVPDGEGETEFLWQGIRVKPKAGTCVMWPAQFTHPHRGNPVYSCDKYIATGWYTYTEY